MEIELKPTNVRLARHIINSSRQDCENTLMNFIGYKLTARFKGIKPRNKKYLRGATVIDSVDQSYLPTIVCDSIVSIFVNIISTNLFVGIQWADSCFR